MTTVSRRGTGRSGRVVTERQGFLAFGGEFAPRDLRPGCRVVRGIIDLIDPRDASLTPADATSALVRTGIGYIVLDHAAASPALVSYLTSLQLRSIGRDGDRELLAV